MKIKKLRFPGSQDYELGARLDLPDEHPPAAFALFAHCFTCTKNLKAIGNISRALAERGIAVLRFDFTGLGESEGDFADTNFSSNVEDLIAAASFLKSDYQAPKILIGHSLGGAAVIQAAHDIPACVAVATIAAPSNLEHLNRLLVSTKEKIEREGVAEVTLGGRTFTIKKQFFDDLAEKNMRWAIAGLERALLILHSPVDQTVGIDNAHQIFTTARHPKSFISLDRAGHLLMDERDSLYVGAMIATWASRYI
jgi:alpha/beta superfamily hydrolase